MLVIAMICIDKHELLSGFTGKLHFVSPFGFHTLLFPVCLVIYLKVQISFKKKVKLRTLKSRNLMPFLHISILIEIAQIAKLSPNTEEAVKFAFVVRRLT